MASFKKQQRQTAAWLLAEGVPPRTVAEQVEINQNTLRRWMDQEDFQQDVDERRAEIASHLHQAKVKYLLNLPQVSDNMVSMALNPQHPKHFDACVHVIDKLMPTKQVQESHSHHTVDVTFWKSLDERLDKLKSLPTPDPKLVSGKEAAETYGLQASLPGNNGSNTPEPAILTVTPEPVDDGERSDPAP